MFPKMKDSSGSIISREQALQRLVDAGDINTDNVDAAIQVYEEVLDVYPELAEAVSGLAMIYIYRGEFNKAYPLVEKLLGLQPDEGQSWYLKGVCLDQKDKCIEALNAFEAAEKAGYDMVSLSCKKASCLAKMNRFDEAMVALDYALNIDPTSSNALGVKANIYEVQGNVNKAKDCYELLLRQFPSEPSILFRLSLMKRLSQKNFKKCDPSHKDFKDRKLSSEQVSLLYFARAKEEERRENYDKAFADYELANKCIRDIRRFDRDNQTRRTNAHIEAFSSDLFEKCAPFACQSSRPVFIVGMPRSGTTLMEQILSSHPDVVAAGEISCITGIESRLFKITRGYGDHYPYSFHNIDPRSLENFASHYARHVDQYISESARYVTDKMPTNFLNLGLIHIIYPNAKIIHMSRNALDTCVSCFFQKFKDIGNLSWSFDLEDLGFFYNEYLRLMDHWKSVLPGTILDVQYEDLVEHQEDVSRKVLEYMDLEWDDRCLEFFNNRRAVTTASMYQVRKPVYKNAMGKWHHYEKYLGLLMKTLDAPHSGLSSAG